MLSPRGTAVAAVLLHWTLAGFADAQSKPVPTQADGVAATEIERRLTVDRDVNAQNVTIYVVNGVATLTGRVPGEGVKRRAERLAADVPGVTRVQNRITAGLAASSRRAPTTIPEQMPNAD